MGRSVEAEWRERLDRWSAGIPLDQALHQVAVDEGSDAPFSVVDQGLDALAAGVVAARDPLEQLRNVVRHLFDGLGFRGDRESYDAPENSRIDRVLERRRGLPITLSAVVLEVGRRRGLALVGVGFPGHFLVGTAGEPRLFVDPFDQGRIRRRSELAHDLRARFGDLDDAQIAHALAPTSTHDLLVRVSGNLLGSWTRRSNLAAALPNADRRVALRPDVPEFRRDRGLVRAELGLGEEAAFDLGSYLAERPDAPDAAAIRWRIAVAAHAGAVTRPPAGA
ncbi:MAG: transglutaminase-like domain-containing protein [Myxococcota bacterium]